MQKLRSLFAVFLFHFRGGGGGGVEEELGNEASTVHTCLVLVYVSYPDHMEKRVGWERLYFRFVVPLMRVHYE